MRLAPILRRYKMTEEKNITPYSEKLAKHAGIIRDIGLILGVPTILAVMLHFHQATVKLHQATAKSQQQQIDYLKETQYSEALTQIKALEEISLREKSLLKEQIQKQIALLEIERKDREKSYMELSKQVADYTAASANETMRLVDELDKVRDENMKLINRLSNIEQEAGISYRTIGE